MEIKTKYNVNERVYFWDGLMTKHGNVEEITIKVIQGNATKKVRLNAKPEPIEVELPDLEQSDVMVHYKVSYKVPGRIATKVFCERDLFHTEEDLALSAVFNCFAR